MRKYQIDGKLHQATGNAANVSDWFVDFVGRAEGERAHFICIQFGSIGVSEDEAKGIVTKMLAGLNGETP